MESEEKVIVITKEAFVKKTMEVLEDEKLKKAVSGNPILVLFAMTLFSDLSRLLFEDAADSGEKENSNDSKSIRKS